MSELLRTNPSGALAFLQAEGNDTDNGRWIYNSTLPKLLPTLFKSDPKNALALAKGLSDPQSHSEALIVVADLLRIADARPLYQEAETDFRSKHGTPCRSPIGRLIPIGHLARPSHGSARNFRAR